MAKFVLQSIQDAGLDAIAAATEMYYCSGQPANRAAAIAAKVHAAAITMASGDFAKSGTTDRVLTVAAKNVTANAAATLDHIALCSATALLYVTTTPSQSTNNGATITGAAFTVTASALA